MQQPSRAVFLGSKALGLSVLRALRGTSSELAWTIVHPDDTADQRSCLDAFRTYAREQGLDLRLAGSPSAARELLRELRPDIGFVCGWYWLLDADALALAPHGLWGIHNSLLPRYRGGAPLVWSMIHGEPVVGSTVFRIGEGMDDGEILHRVRVECGSDDAIGTMLARIEAQLVAEVPGKWRRLLNGEAELIEQDHAQATYCGQRSDPDGLVNWNWPAKRVHDFIRAQSAPYPCAFSFLGRDQVRLVRARPWKAVYHGTPGQVLLRQTSSVLVACGESTAIELLRLSFGPPSGEVDAADAIRSIKARFTDAPQAA